MYYTTGITSENNNEENLKTDNSNKITITHNSINGLTKSDGKFFFGKFEPKQSRCNDINFIDDTIGSKQFEITYNKGTFCIIRYR